MTTRVRRMGWAVVLLAGGAVAQASPVTRAAQDGWRALARADADAALALIEANHPGAAAELGDADFLGRLARARTTVDARLPKVTDYESYALLMLGLANTFGDGHIWSSALVQRPSRTWAGVVMVRRAGQWAVGAQERDGGEPDLTNALLVSCDGVSAERLGRERVGGFFANPDDEAELAGNAYQLLLDNGDAFLPRPQRCRFKTPGGRTVELTLRWRTVPAQHFKELVVGALHIARAGLGVRDFRGGKWIALQTFGPEAEAVVADVEARKDELRAAPMVVVDLRGNGGGDSAFADRLASALAGAERVAALSSQPGECSGDFWRASPGNLDTLRSTRARHRDAPQLAAYFDELIADTEAALKAGRAFAPALPACARTATSTPTRPVKAAPAAMKGRLVLVTDRACFSSCLLAVDLFLRLGALQVGEATGRSTRYMEVREVVLPSGLRTFSTLQKLALGAADFGPYAPAASYPRPMDDTGGLEAWVADVGKGKR